MSFIASLLGFEQTWVLTENGPNIMRIYTDGRTHPPADEMWPTFTGDSVGHWDGQALVFTTVSMIGGPETVLDRSGLTLSKQASISTRMFLTDDGLLRATIAFVSFPHTTPVHCDFCSADF